MDESLSSKLFINSDQVGDYADIVMPASGKRKEEEIRIHYLEAGIGEPLLLIHGIGQSLYTWRSVFADLSDCYRIIAIDLPGHGYSSRPESFCYSMDEMAEMLKLFLDAKGIQSTHIVGFSTGSIYMMRFIKLYPQYAANCIAISPGGITKQMPALYRNMNRPILSIFSRNLFTANDVKKCLLECVYDKTNIDERVVSQYYEPIEDGITRENLMYAVRNFDMKYVTEDLKDVDHEILLLWGREDKWHVPNSSVYFQGVLQNGRYFLVRNAGHLIQEDTPDKLIQVIVSYIPPVFRSASAYFADLDIRSGESGEEQEAPVEEIVETLAEEATETVTEAEPEKEETAVSEGEPQQKEPAGKKKKKRKTGKAMKEEKQDEESPENA